MYEFALMVSITLLGYCGVPWWGVLPAAALLPLPTLLQLAPPATAWLRETGGRGRLALSCWYCLLAAVCFAGGERIALMSPG
jgi:hypothetical protein